MTDSIACRFLQKRDGKVTAIALMRHLKITWTKACEIVEEWNWGKG